MLFRHPRGRSKLSNLPGKQTAKREESVPQAWIPERWDLEASSGCFVAWRVVRRQKRAAVFNDADGRRATPQALRNDKNRQQVRLMCVTSVIKRGYSPVGVTLLVLGLYLGAVLARSGGDPMAFVRIGSRYQVENAVDSEGYDGQFVYFIARNPDPDVVAPYLDVPAYRYQRILLPLLARALAFGCEEALPWMLAAIGIIAHAAGTGIVQRLLVQRGSSRWFALVYGLWAGLLLAVRLDLPEPLAYALVAAGILLEERKPPAAWMLFGLAVFAKEGALLFVAGKLLVEVANRRWREVLGLSVISLLPFVLFQGWLTLQFGSPGIGSGGAMATGFEWIPFMGLLRIGSFSALLLLAFGIIVVPFFFGPAIWGLVESGRRLLRRSFQAETGYLFVNAFMIPFLPFSTVREPGGLFRFGTGFVLAYLLYSSRYQKRRAMIYSLAWLALTVVVWREIL